MNMLGPRVKVVEAIPQQDFVMRLVFEDGTVKEIDLEPFLRGPVFELIRQDLSLFRQVKIAGGTIAWPNEADIDPDVLYYDLKPAWMLEQAEA
ncbi:MAG: DUF2442 domain-containing protein [Chloroflexota bacterium]